MADPNPNPNPLSQALELLGAGTQDSTAELYPSVRRQEGPNADITSATQATTLRGREEFINVPRNEMFSGSRDFDIMGGAIVNAQSVNIFQGQSSQSHSSTSQRTEHTLGEAYLETRPSLPIFTRALRPNLSQKSCHVYWRNLIVKERGSPLWHPEPNSYPEEYKQQGVSIGDVGLLLPSGSFHFFFNIYYPRDHSINAKGVPEGFVPLHPQIDPDDIEKENVKGANSWYASQNVIASREEDNGELVFESSAEEGAILTLPCGSHSEDLIALRNLRGYIGEHIRQWYRYVVVKRGFEVDNGDIRLVTGWDKTSRWGVAAFSSSLNTVRLTFHPQDGLARSYRWQHSGSLDSKTGPQQEGTELHDPPQSKNQCVFVRTLNASFREDVWTALNKELSLEVRTGSDHLEFPDDQYRPPVSVVNTQNSTNYQRETESSRGHSHQQSRDTSRAMMPHPSRRINDLLWQLVPLYTNSTATVMISQDTDWISVLQKGDSGLPEPQELYVRIQRLPKASVTNQDGVFFLNYLRSTQRGEQDNIRSRLRGTQGGEQMIIHSVEGYAGGEQENIRSLLMGPGHPPLSSFTLSVLNPQNFNMSTFNANLRRAPKRVPMVCTYCRQKKQKCRVDQGQTRCQKCVHQGLDCRFGPGSPEMFLSKDWLGSPPYPMHTVSGLQENPGLQRPLYTSCRQQYLASNDHGVRYHREHRSTPQQDYTSSQEQFSEAGPSLPVTYPVFSVPVEYQPSFGPNSVNFEEPVGEMGNYYDCEGYPNVESLPNQHVDQFQTEAAQEYGYEHSQHMPEDLLAWPGNSSLNISHVTNGQGPFDPSGYPYLAQRQASAQGYYAQETDPDNQDFSNIYDPTIYSSQ